MNLNEKGEEIKMTAEGEEFMVMKGRNESYKKG